MKKKSLIKAFVVFLALMLGAPQGAMAQSADGAKTYKQEELDQLVAPIALYPDSLVTQILMASTYPLEVVEAARWANQNKDLKGDALANALERQPWDPSVKSLVNFPQVLTMMNEKLDWTQRLGDAFLAQQKDVMGTIQQLRLKAQAAGNLKTTTQQVVTVEKEVIIIEPASPQVVYVPTYNPTVVYGAWPYPAYPPYYYYPPGYVAGAAFTFAAGVAVGAAWGYAWGHCNWRGGEVNVNINQNTNLNRNINRSSYQNKVTTGPGGQGTWQHNPEHRKGVSYRDNSTAQRFGRAGTRDVQSRENFRGRADAGRQDLGRGDRSTGGRQDFGRGDSGSFGSGARDRRDSGGFDKSGSRQTSDRSAFSGTDRGGSARDASSRGRESLSSSRGGGGGGSRSFSGGGGRGGGGRR